MISLRGKYIIRIVEKLYSLRLKYKSGTPINLIAKLLMSSMYGKFGMNLKEQK